jgi:hypothetical protein
MRPCLKDGKQCYIHHDKETGFEVRCRHYDLIGYAGVCPEVSEKFRGTVKHKDGSGYTYFANEYPELRKFELDLWNATHDAGFLPEITLVVPFKKVLEIFAKDVLPYVKCQKASGTVGTKKRSTDARVQKASGTVENQENRKAKE